MSVTVLALIASFATPARAGEPLVAVAANFAVVVQALQPRFEAATGHRIRTTTGSTGKLYAQVVAGAPFAVLLSADQATPARLEAEGHGVAGSRFTYAVGRLVLWSADPERIGADGRAALLDPDLRFVAMANPDLAPYGIAARQAMEAMGVWDRLAERIAVGQNIGHAHALVASGAAEVGFVAGSAVLSADGEPRGSRWDVPAALFEPIRQDALLLRRAADDAAAIAFLAFLRSPEAVEVIERFGYGVE